MSKTSLADWIAYYDDIGIPKDVYNLYLPYVEALLKKKLPVILDFKQLASILGRQRSYLASLINCSEKHYRIFSIPKRRGGKRDIEAPYPALLECQRWIHEHILPKARLHRDVHGFRPKHSIITNATSHLGSDEFLTIDLKNFFPSIPISRVIKVFSDLGYPSHVAFLLAAICCLKGRLPQGAPTSPALSNIIAKGLDTRLSRLAAHQNLQYTRYADDITFSGDRIQHWIIPLVNKIIVESGFTMNSEKTKLLPKNSNRRIVTGIDIKEDRLSVPGPYRRAITQDIYHIEKWGIQGHMAHNKIRDPEYLNRLIGKLNFWRQVEPSSTYPKNKLKRLHTLRSREI